jgi:predicted site-specific integrase-resolvase
MHGAYIFTETIWQADRKVCEHAAKMGPQRHFACFPYTHQSALLHPRTISGLSRVDFLGAGAGDCVCSCVFPGQKKDLAIQKEALRAYCQEHAIKVDQWVQDIGSALNYQRKGFNQVIEQIELGLVRRVVIGYQDRFVRFGYDWFEQFCERHGTEITFINGETFSPEEELVRDLIAIVTVFSARLHGLRSHKNLIRAAALGKEIADDQGA